MSATPTVAAVGQVNLEGNIIPHNWYNELKRENGKPNLNAIIILAEIVYWYRPTAVKDETTGQPKGSNRKFHADLLQRTYKSFADQFGLSKGQVQDAIKYLEDQGLITRVLRTVHTDAGMVLPNTLYIDLHVERLKEITYPATEQPMSGSEETPPLIERDTSPAETADITEITTENTEETTTTSGGGSESAGLPDDVPFGEVAKVYQNEIGLYSAVIADMMEDDYSTYGGQWIIDAIKVAVAANKRKYNYVRGVLRRWHTEGRQDEQTKQQQDTAPVVVRISGGDM